VVLSHPPGIFSPEYTVLFICCVLLSKIHQMKVLMFVVMLSSDMRENDNLITTLNLCSRDSYYTPNNIIIRVIKLKKGGCSM
jgi:hypothetical protein